MTTKQVQHLLAYLGYTVAPDGICGEQTQSAVALFQQDYGGLDVDGVPGQLTQTALQKAIGSSWQRPAEEPAETSNIGTFWDEIKHFTPDEPYIRCPCGKCAGELPKEKLMRLADRVRELAGVPMIPTSTVRCTAHNAAVGGVSTSRHLYGRAMDFYIKDWNAQKTLALVKQQPEVAYAYAIDDSTVHMDVL